MLELAPTPPANELPIEPRPDNECYALNLMKCDECQHLQLDTEISMFRLFKNDYVYTSNTSASNLAYFDSYAKAMMKRFRPQFVVDIGSNDGTFLHFFKQAGRRVLGVDPAENIVALALANNVETMCAFFNEMKALVIEAENGKPDLITCNNMFAHNRNLDEILLGVKSLLSPEGTFVFEVSYAMKLLENSLFDLIYHEHYHHWHLTPAMKYFQKFGLEIYDAEVITATHGGSIRVFVKHKAQFGGKTVRLKTLLKNERDNFAEHLSNFMTNVPKVKAELQNILKGLKAKGKRIAVLGYPAKACTLSYYFGLQDYICNVYDDNPLKIGKYTHQGLKIEPATFIYKNKPDYLLVLSWNYKKELMERHKLFKRTGGKFIIPFPKPEVI